MPFDRATVERLLEGDAFFWLDLSRPSQEDFNVLRDVFKFHPLAVEDSEQFDQRAKIDAYDDFVFIVVYGAQPDNHQLVEVHCFYSERFLVTVQGSRLRRSHFAVFAVGLLAVVLATQTRSTLAATDEDDDTDPNRPEHGLRLCERRRDEKEKNAPPIITSTRGTHDQGEQADAGRRLGNPMHPRSPTEHPPRPGIGDQQQPREDDERDCVEGVEALERLAVMMGGHDDEAHNRRTETETEVACDSSECGRCGALLHQDQGQRQDLAGGSCQSKAGTADGRADEALPRTVDKHQAPVAECIKRCPRSGSVSH